MPAATDSRPRIAAALAAFGSRPQYTAALEFLGALVYESERRRRRCRVCHAFSWQE